MRDYKVLATGEKDHIGFHRLTFNYFTYVKTYRKHRDLTKILLCKVVIKPFQSVKNVRFDGSAHQKLLPNTILT